MGFNIDTSTGINHGESLHPGDKRGGSGSYQGVYNDGQTTLPRQRSGDSADEVDPRNLVRTPTLNEIRWYYNRTFAKTLVDKPVEDAFKHGYELQGPDADRVQSILDAHDYIEKYKYAEKKARRDGFALLFFVLKDTTQSIAEDPNDGVVTAFEGINVLTIDDLYRGGGEVRQHVDLDFTEYEVRDTGIVVDKRINEPTYNEPLGYLLGGDSRDKLPDVQFIHKNRVQHLVWNPEIDGDLGANTLGRWEGDSILVPAFDLLKSLKKANWAIGQTLFRYASKLYAVNLPEDANEADQQEASNQLRNLNSKSELILPHGYEIEDYQTDGQLEPRDYFDVLFEQICASMEMTKSVLFGTQQGTVTGSETDIKNYFSKVERYRTVRAASKMIEFAERVSTLMDGRATNISLDATVDWAPLFKLDEREQVEVFRTMANTLNMAINGFMLTPDEGRNILNEQWAEWNVDLTDLTDEEVEMLESINLHQVGQESAEERAEAEGNPMEQNGGGRVQGENSESSQPQRDDGVAITW